MTVTADEILRLRRMVAEPATTTYSDAALTEVIERYPIPDIHHHMPDPYIVGLIDDWLPTYDLNAAAAEIWQEKVAALQGTTDFSADGGNYSDGQKYDHAMQQVRFYLSRRSAHTVKQIKWPPEREFYHEHRPC